MFYNYRQNNSGGFHKEPAKWVIVEADSAEEANKIAGEHGVYFEFREGDCNQYHCCGSRWMEAAPSGATDEPMIYNVPAQEYRNFLGKRPSVLIVRKGDIPELFNAGDFDDI